MSVQTGLERAVGAPSDRRDGRLKVTGQATYAAEHAVEGAVYAVAVQAPVARGTIRAVDGTDALAVSGVLAVISHDNAPPLRAFGVPLGLVEDNDVHLFQSPEIHHRGQYVAAVVAESIEAAEEGANRVRLDIDAQPHDVVLRADHDGFYAPEVVNAGYPADSFVGDFEAAFAQAPVTVDETYTTAAVHHNAMETHATVAVWDGDGVTLYDSNQGAHLTRDTVAHVFELEPEQVRVIAQHVGGGFGSKALPRPGTILAALAAKVVGRPVRTMVTRRAMFAVTGYRTPTISRVRLGAEPDGGLLAIGHDALLQTSHTKEFVEQAAVPSRMLYAAPHRRTTHRVTRLDMPTPSWMRAPGLAPGTYALECAIDELAVRLDVDPIDLRIRNEPPIHPELEVPWSSRLVVECLREGAERFGWNPREPRREGDWLVGTGVALSTYPSQLFPSVVTIRERNGSYEVRIDATDIGTGARTVISQIAADALDVPVDRIALEVGDSALPPAFLAGASAGTASWGTAVVVAAEKLRREGADEVTLGSEEVVQARANLSYHSFGAQFVEVRVDADTGEVRVPRAVGVFDAGRIVNPKTARSQLISGMTWGISMALHEESVLDPRFGHFVNSDFADYHVACHADIGEIDAFCLDEPDEHANPLGIKGIGEVGIVGTAAAVANAIHHATGVRVRDLPIRLDKLVERLG